MKFEACFGNALRRVPVSQGLVKPETEKDYLECSAVSRAVRNMIPKRLVLCLSADNDVPLVSLRYGNAPRPKLYWSRHLWIRVDLEEGGSWMARLSHIVPTRREILIAPLDQEAELARYAVQQADPKIAWLHLGTIFTVDRQIRSFCVHHLLQTIH